MRIILSVFNLVHRSYLAKLLASLPPCLPLSAMALSPVQMIRKGSSKTGMH